MAIDAQDRPFTWDVKTGLVAMGAAGLAVTPLIGFLLAWHQAAALAAYTRWAILPALLGLGACELWLVHRSPRLFNRFATGLLGGLAGTVAYDAVRWPAAYAVKGAPDYVPMIGQLMLGETVGIAPTLRATVLGYGFHYVLVGALCGAAYSLVLGRGRLRWGALAGFVTGLAFVALPQARLLAVASGYSLSAATFDWLLAFVAGGAVLGGVVRRLGRTEANAFTVVFWREAPVEALEETLAGRR